MRRLEIAFVLGGCFMLLASPFVQAQSAEEFAARSAQEAGQYRQAFTHYMAAWTAALDAYDQSRSPSTDQALDRIRLAIFTVVRRLDPPPVIPDGAIALEGRAEAAIKAAQSPRDYNDANDAYRLAIRQAPWVPRLYFNRAVVGEKMGDTPGAIANLAYYLQAAPDADDATEVKKKIAGLQYLLEKNASTKAAAQTAAAQQAATIASLSSGTWCMKHQAEAFGDSCASGAPGYGSISLRVSGNQITYRVDSHNGAYSGAEGVIEGLSLRGNWWGMRSDGLTDRRPFTGSISPDGKVITIMPEGIATPTPYVYVRIR